MQQKRVLPLLSLFLLPVPVWALGLGDIHLKSALNQRLDADIELVSATPEELNNLEVSLASRETFGNYGLDYPGYLNDLRFNIVNRADGNWVVHITSTQPLREPFATFLVEADWARGRLLREYTVLLDPPVFTPVERPATAVTTPTTGAEGPRAGTIRTAPAPAPGVVPVRDFTAVDGSYGPISRGETLWEIANRVTTGGVSIDQTMMALYDANPRAFIGNINLVKEGAVLRVPTADELARTSRSAARGRVAEHHAEWRSLPGVAAGGQLRLVVPGETARPGTSASSAELEAQRAENERLSERMTDLETELSDAHRRIELQNEELAALQAQLGAMQESEALTETTPDIIETEPVMPGVDLEPEISIEPEIGPEPAVTTPTVTTTPAEPTFIERAIGFLTSWGLWILGGLALIAVLVVFLKRRREAEDEEPVWEQADEMELPELERDSAGFATEPIGLSEGESMIVVERDPGDTITEEIIVPEVQPAPIRSAEETHEPLVDLSEGEDEEYPFEQTLSDDTALKLQLDESDVMAEADFHMAYGLYDQASNLMEKAVEGDPDRNDYRMKLVEIYFIWGNKEKFLESASEFKNAVGATGGDWDKIMIMGKQICPDELLFAGLAALSAGEAVDLDLAATQYATKVDMVTEDSGEEAIDLDFGADFGAPETRQPLSVDIDLETTGETAMLSEDTMDPGDEPTSEVEAFSDESLDLNLNRETDLFKTSADVGDGTKTMQAPDIDLSRDEDATAIAEKPGISIGPDDATVLSSAVPGDEPTVKAESLDTSGDSDLTVKAESAGAAAPDEDLTVKAESLADDEESTVIRTIVMDQQDAIDEDTQQTQVLREDTYEKTQKIPGRPADEIDEVGTKLDLARAFMDMGDPDGARSILNEVLVEGSDAQKSEARGLIDGLR